MLPKASITSIINEEISLEGLEGTTLDALWNRIAVRLEMPMPLPQKLMGTIWLKVTSNPEFEYYLLPEPRKPFVLFNRLSRVDPDTGIPVQSSVYPGYRFKYKPIEANGIRGSCEDYHRRSPIPQQQLLSITSKQAEEKYGLKLVIVASQRMRESFLIHPNCTADLSIMQYCMLEWIGRSRFNGETTQGKFSLLEMCGESSSLFYNRKALCVAKLITRQYLSIRMDDSSVQGMVFHLPRYYREMKSKQLLLAERVVAELKKRENFVADYEEMKLLMLGRVEARKLFRTPEFLRYIKTDEMVPYRQIYPKAPESSWQNKRGEEKHIRVMRLIDPNIDVQDREGLEDSDAKDAFLPTADSSMQCVDVPLLRQAYKLVGENDTTGLSQTEIGTLLELDRLNARALLKNMVRLKVVESMAVDHGRQRMAKFFLPNNVKRAFVFNKELTQFISNHQEVIGNQQKQPQPSKEAKEPWHLSLEHLVSDAESLKDTYETMSSGSATGGASNDIIAASTVTEEGDIMLPLDVFNNAVQHCVVTSVMLSNKLRPLRVKYSAKRSVRTKCAKSALMLRRCNFIIQLVKQERAIEPRSIFKHLSSDERDHGHKYEACSKSILRLLAQLAVERLVVIANVTIKRDKRECHLVYVCDPKIVHDLAPLQSKINMANARVALQTSALTKDDIEGNDGNDDGNDGNDGNNCEGRTKQSSQIRENLNCLPKCLRMKLFHEFLFYLVYELRPNACQVPVRDLRTIVLNGMDESELLAIYSDTNDWKMFIPPIVAKYDAYSAGWVLLADVIVRMPLYIFCSIGAFTFYNEELDHYLDHPIRRNILIKHLPERIQYELFVKRRYIYAILREVKLLCYVGLVQMGPQLAKVLDQTILYVNRTAAILDTTYSGAGYNEIENRDYPVLSFQFNALADLKDYWRKLYAVCTGTRINARSTAVGREILVQNITTKPALIESTRERTDEVARANDCNKLPPGDAKGAAGMDTGMFMHLRTNWQKMVTFSKSVDRHRLKKIRKVALMWRTSRTGGLVPKADRKRLALKKFARSATANPANGGGGGGSGASKATPPTGPPKWAVKRRLIHPPKTVLRRSWVEGYDEVDRKALKMMNKLRVSWTMMEDHLLLVCRVAMLYLCGFGKNASCPIHSVVYRDIMHWTFEHAQNKTARACQRRVSYMMTKMSGYADQVRTMLEECKLDAEIGARYGLDFMRKLRERFVNVDEYTVAIRIHYVQLVHILRVRYAGKLLSGQPADGRVAVERVDAPETLMRKLPQSLAEFYRQYNVTDPSVDKVRLNYSADPTNESELLRYKLAIVLHSAIANRRSTCDKQLQVILNRHPRNSVNEAANLLRGFQIASVNAKTTGGKVIITSGSLAGEKRILHLSITYQQQLASSIPFEAFVPLFVQLGTLFGRERYAEEPYECEDGGDSMALLLSELVAVGKVDLSIDLATNYIEMRPDAVQGHSEMLQQLRGQCFTEFLPGDAPPSLEDTPTAQSLPPAKRTRRSLAQSGAAVEAIPAKRGKATTFVEPRKKTSAGSSSGKRSVTKTPRGSTSASRSKGVHFSTGKITTFHYAMHPIELLAKLPIEYFHFFCLLEQLKLADRRLLAQTFKIDQQQPSTCFLTNCVVSCGSSGDLDLIGRCLALVRGNRDQLQRIREEGEAQNRTIARKVRLDTAQFFDVREDNLQLFFRKYIDEYHAQSKHKRDINQQQQQQQGLARAAVNMADLIVECLSMMDEGPPSEQCGWLSRYEKTDTISASVEASAEGGAVVASVVTDAVDDEEEEAAEGVGEEGGRKVNDLLSALSEKVFKLHNFYEVTSKKIHVQVRAVGRGDANQPIAWESYGQWQIPHALLPSGARRRKEILLKIASDAVWLQSEEMAPLMTEAMALIGRNPRARKLLEFIERKATLGATVGELGSAFPNHVLLAQHLRTLESFKCVLRTGYRSVTYVHWRFVDVWLTKAPLATATQEDAQSSEEEEDSPEESEPEEVAGPSSRKRSGSTSIEEVTDGKRSKVDFIDPDLIVVQEQPDDEVEPVTEETTDNKYVMVAMAPWIQIDGKLDKRLLYRWLSSILLYCVAHPGVPFSVLFSRFNMMSPFHLRQLAEMLEHYGCISLHSLEDKAQRTLFSAFKPAQIVPVSEFCPDDQSYIETSPNALSTLALCIGESRRYTQELYDPVRIMKRAKATKETLEDFWNDDD